MSCYWGKIVNKQEMEVQNSNIVRKKKKKKKKKKKNQNTQQHLRGNRKVSLFISDGFRHDDE